MKTRTHRLLGAAFILLLWAQAATAGCPPDLALSRVTYNSTYPEVSLFTVPDGSGSSLINCYAFPGQAASAAIEVLLRDAAGPCTGYPPEYVRLNHLAPATQVWCPDALYGVNDGPNVADMHTNLLGFTRFTQSYHGGGHALSTQVWIYNGAVWQALPTVVNVRFNSADLNGDLVVNLTDVALFAAIFGGPYDYRADYNWDGNVNLTDVVLLASAYGVTCP